MQDDLKKIEKYNFQYIHVDIMDGHFVPNITFGFEYTNKLSNYIKLPKDIHLMMDYPDLAVRNLKLSKEDIVIFHVESRGDPLYTIKSIKDKGAKVGLAINPDTPIENLFPFIEIVDHILVMTVHPGFAGHPFVENSYERLKKLIKITQKKYPHVIIGVDGAIGFEQIMVLGTTALFKKKDLPKQLIKLSKFINKLKQENI